MPSAPEQALQPDGGTAAQGHRARLYLHGRADQLAQPDDRRLQAQDQGDGEPLPLYRVVRVAGESPRARRLPQARDTAKLNRTFRSCMYSLPGGRDSSAPTCRMPCSATVTASM